ENEPFPDQVTGGRMVFDTARSRSVYLEGSFGEGQAVWEWNGTWHGPLPPGSATRPPDRYYHAMAYDTSRARTLVFGGGIDLSSTLRSDTWEWDGANWLQRAAGGIPARKEHVMAYDSLRNRTVVFGGLGSSGYLTDTWEWNGSAAVWTELAVSGPS